MYINSVISLIIFCFCLAVPYALSQPSSALPPSVPGQSAASVDTVPQQEESVSKLQNVPASGSPELPSPMSPATPQPVSPGDPGLGEGNPPVSASTPQPVSPVEPPVKTAPPAFLDANTIFRRNHVENMCVLSFDDGPGPYTAQLLDALREEGVPAIFFVLGKRISLYPDLVRRMLEEGHEVGSHSYSHPNLRRKSVKVQEEELKKTDALLRELGVQPRYFRPPYGNSTPFVRQLAGSMGMAVVLWTADSLDWKRCPSDYRKIDGATCNGRMRGVFLFHDIQKHTVDDLHRIVRELRAGGCDRFVTLTEYMEGSEQRKELSYQAQAACPATPSPSPQEEKIAVSEAGTQEVLLPVTPPQQSVVPAEAASSAQEEAEKRMSADPEASLQASEEPGTASAGADAAASFDWGAWVREQWERCRDFVQGFFR